MARHTWSATPTIDGPCRDSRGTHGAEALTTTLPGLWLTENQLGLLGQHLSWCKAGHSHLREHRTAISRTTGHAPEMPGERNGTTRTTRLSLERRRGQEHKTARHRAQEMMITHVALVMSPEQILDTIKSLNEQKIQDGWSAMQAQRGASGQDPHRPHLWTIQGPAEVTP